MMVNVENGVRQKSETECLCYIANELALMNQIVLVKLLRGLE
jgi:hypothetical protein